MVVAGHSAGGQFTNRFAAGSRVAPELQEAGIDVVHFVIANPSSYLYLSSERPVPVAEKQVSLTRFAVPSQARRADCPTYDDYKHGLRQLNTYMAAVGASEIRSQYRQRSVTYLLGAKDNDTDAAGLSKGCEASFQGFHRLERGTAFFDYLKCFYGPASMGGIRYPSFRALAIAAKACSTRPAGRRALFGVGLPPPAAPLPDCRLVSSGP